MSAIQNKPYISEAEYLEFERASETKHEYFRGEVFAMAGASKDHNSIAGSIYRHLYDQVRKKGCQLFASDMRLKVLATGLFTYPDLAVYCGDIVFTGDKPDTVTNPTIIIEVLSPSTELHDRNTKFRHYQQIPSLQEYILVSQDTPRIESFRRQKDKDTWTFVDIKGLDGTIEFPTIEATLALANAYEQVTFPEKSDSSGLL
jgi:Uma2 family endonuclease